MLKVPLAARFIGILTGYFIYGSARKTANIIQYRVLNVFSDYDPNSELLTQINTIEDTEYESRF